jgi:hypothetical protein
MLAIQEKYVDKVLIEVKYVSNLCQHISLVLLAYFTSIITLSTFLSCIASVFYLYYYFVNIFLLLIIEVKYVSNAREICWQSNNRGKIR